MYRLTLALQNKNGRQFYSYLNKSLINSISEFTVYKLFCMENTHLLWKVLVEITLYKMDGEKMKWIEITSWQSPYVPGPIYLN